MSPQQARQWTPMFLSLSGSGPGSLLLGRAVVHAALFPQGPAGRAAHVSPRPVFSPGHSAAGLPASLTVDVHM